MTKLASITIYPIKSLDGVGVTEVEVLPSGALRNDRRWAIVDGEGQVVNGKRTAAIHAIRAKFSPGIETVTLSHSAFPPITFPLADCQPELGDWLSQVLGIPSNLVENRITGFPDDLDAPGPTVVSAGTLVEVARWFEISPVEVHRRFRVNVVIDAADAFWEDRLVGEIGTSVPFKTGHVEWLGVNPCQRCVVPSRDSQTGVPNGKFQREFATLRENTLPPWAPRGRFDHFYRLTVNTQLAEGNADLRLCAGDEVHYLVPNSSPH